VVALEQMPAKGDAEKVGKGTPSYPEILPVLHLKWVKKTRSRLEENIRYFLIF